MVSIQHKMHIYWVDSNRLLKTYWEIENIVENEQLTTKRICQEMLCKMLRTHISMLSIINEQL